MSNYKPSLPFNVPFILLKPITTTVSGVRKKSYPSITEALTNADNIFYGNHKSYGGTERDVNGVYSIEDTVNVETWYRTDLKSDCRVARVNDNSIFEIINEPEDINFRHQFLKFKIRRIKGGV